MGPAEIDLATGTLKKEQEEMKMIIYFIGLWVDMGCLWSI